MSQTTHLLRRKGVYHYRRRVPPDLAAAIGCREIHRSLGTSSLADAKKLRALEDLKWDARFETAAGINPVSAVAKKPSEPLARSDALRLVQQFVARMDQDAEQTALKNPPANEQERSDVIVSDGESFDCRRGLFQCREIVRPSVRTFELIV